MAKKKASKKAAVKEAAVEAPVDSEQEPEVAPAIAVEPVYKTVDSGAKGKAKHRKPSVVVQTKSEFEK